MFASFRFKRNAGMMVLACEKLYKQPMPKQIESLELALSYGLRALEIESKKISLAEREGVFECLKKIQAELREKIGKALPSEEHVHLVEIWNWAVEMGWISDQDLARKINQPFYDAKKEVEAGEQARLRLQFKYSNIHFDVPPPLRREVLNFANGANPADTLGRIQRLALLTNAWFPHLMQAFVPLE